MNQKFKKTNLILPSIVMTSLAVAPIMLLANNSINVSQLSIVTSSDGFSLETKTFSTNDAQIVLGQFQNSEFHSTQDSVSANISKILVSNNNFTMNFIPGSILSGNSGTIIATNFSEPGTISHTLEWTGVGNINQTSLIPRVVSAQLIGSRLWIISLGHYTNSGDLSYVLQSFNLRLSQEGNLERISPSGNPISIPINISNNIQSPVIAPVYRNALNGELELDQNQVFVYEQNGLLMNDSAKMQKFSARGDIIQQETISVGQLPSSVQNNARIMSIFIYQERNQNNYEYGIYHSFESDMNVKIAYTSLQDSIPITIYNENIKTLNGIDINNQMSYPKVLKTSNGYELFWVHSRPSPNSSENVLLSSKVFSTKLNQERKPLPILEQPKILNLGEIQAGTRDFALIDYRDNGSFDDGTVYIPVKYKGFGEFSGVDVPSYINWKDTSNEEYWNITPGQSPSDMNQVFIPPFSIPSDQGYQLANTQAILQTAIIQSIDTENNRINYLFRNVDTTNLSRWFSQPRNLNNDVSLTPLSMSYNTITPDKIITQISIQNPPYQEGVTTIENIRRQIQDSSKNFLTLRPGIFGDLIAISDLEFKDTSIGQEITTNVTYNAGFYENGILKLPSQAIPISKKVTLIQQPETFIPLNISINVTTGFTNSSSNFVSRINNEANNIPPTGIPGLIGDSPNDLVQITSLYIPFLDRITAWENTFTGEVSLNFSFRNSNNEPQQKIIDIKGFAANQWIIAIVVPIVIIIATIIITIALILNHKKKKKDMFKALQAGISLKQKMESKTTSEQPFSKSHSKIIKPTNSSTSKKNAPS